MPTDFDFQPAETAPDFDFQPEAPPVPRPAVNMQPVSLLSDPQVTTPAPPPPTTQPTLNAKRGGSSGILPPVTMGARRGGLQDTRKLPRFLGGTPPPEPTWKDIVGGAFGALTNPEPGAETGLPDLGAQVASGLKNVTTPGQRTTGALQLAEAGTEAATPLMGPALLENPLSIARGVAEGEIASKATGYGAKKLGATPEQQQLAENLAFWAPGVARSVIDPKVTLASTEEGSAAGVSGFGGRVAAGGKVTPEEVTLGGKVGPFKGSVRIPRGPGAQPAIEPPTIEGHAITRAEVADYMDKANWDPDKARALAAKEQVTEPEPKPESPAVKEPAQAPANFDFQPEVQSTNEQPATVPVSVAKVSGPSVVGGKEKEPVVPSAGARETKQLSSGVSERPVSSSSEPKRTEETPASKNDSVQTSAGVDTTPRDNTGASTPNVPAVDEPKYKHGSTQANIPDESEAAQALETARQRISPSDLAAKGIDVGGNHLTVRYGIKGDDTEGIRKYLSSLTPFEVSLGKTDKFPPSEHSDGAAVIHAPVEAPELHQINKEIEKHGEFSEPSFGEYKPHATVAYVKPDKAARYVGMSATAGKKFTVNSIAITDRNGKQSEVKLEGKGAPVGELDYQPVTKADNAPGAAISKEAEAQPTPKQESAVQPVVAKEQATTKQEPSQSEREALKAKIAALEGKKATPAEQRLDKVISNGKVASFRKLADGLEKQIDDKRRPMTQNPTPERMAEYRSRVIEADELARTQKALRALADAHEAGNVPAELAGLRTKDEIGRLVHKGLDGSKGGYYDRIPRQDYYDKSSAGKKLQEMIEGAKSPEATAAKLAKEKASKISELEAGVQFNRLPGYFPTPKPLAEKLIDHADIRSGMSVLEPSAGKGNIADAIRDRVPDAKLSVVEQAPKLQEILKLKDHNLVDSDFLEHDSHYDRIVMNPPFEKNADVAHVRHAYELLKPGGRLVAIMSPHAEFASDKKSVEFREWMGSLGGESEKLPESSFKESGTGVNSRMVVIDKPQAKESVQPAPKAKEPVARKPIKGTAGSETSLNTSSATIPAKYRVVEAADLLPSHNAQTFAKNVAYPEGVQERTYHTSKEAQTRVIQQGQNYDPNYTINTNPDAVNGPPIITPDGTVLGGNSRAMSTQRLYKSGGGNRYKSALLAQSATFGLDKQGIQLMKEPVLVREIAHPENADATRRLAAELNKSMTGALGVTEKAVSAGKNIKPATLATVGQMRDDMGADATLRDVMRQHGKRLIEMLVNDGALTERERPQIVDTATGGLSEEGKTFVEHALLGSVVDDPVLMQRVPKSILGKIEGSLGELSSLGAREDEYNIMPLVREALNDHAEIAQRGLDVETYLGQTGMFGPARNSAVEAIVRTLAKKPTVVRNAIRQFAQDAGLTVPGQGNLGLIQPPTLDQAFNDAFDAKLTDDQILDGIRDSIIGDNNEPTEAKRPSAPAESLQSESADRAQENGATRSGKDEARAATSSQPENSVGGLFSDESGSFRPSKLLPSAIKKSYATGVEKFISSKLKIGDKYYAVKQDDPVVAEVLHEVDNAPLYYRNKAKANLEKVTKGLTPDQIRLASLLVDSDSRDYLQQHKRDEYKDAINDPEVMAAVERFKPLQEELTKDRQALGWPVRKSLTLEKNETPGENPWIVKDRDGNPVADFKSENQATDYIEENATVEPHLKRTYPEHMRSPLPADTGGGPFTGTFYADKGLRPPRMDKKARIASAEYHYQHGAKDFSGYPESFAKTKEAVLKQQLFDKFTDKATAWKAGTAQPPTIKYNGKTYTRPDIVLKAKQGGTTLEPYGIYDPSRGERFLIKTPAFSTLSTGKPGIGPNDRFLAPKRVVDALERYDATRGGEGAGKLRKFFQEQIVGLFGPVVHVNNILRHAAQATGALGTFDPRSWPTLQKIIFSGDVRKQVLKGLDDSTIDMLSRGGSYTDWSDIGNLNAYIGGNLNPANWIRSFGKGVLFNPKFAGGWGGLDPKARTVVADFLKDHVPGITDPEIRSAVEDGFGNYNRKNWTERQRMIAKFTLFPGWDTASFKWFLRHPILTALVPAAVMLAANLAMNSLGKNKDQDKYDFSYLHYGDRKFRSGLITDSMASHVAEPVLAGIQAAIKDEEIGAAVGEGFIRGAGSLAGTLVPEIQLIAEQLFNRKFAGSASEIVSREDKNIPGKVLPNRDLEKRAIFAALKIFPAVGRFLAPDQTIDLQTGIGSALGVTNYKYGAEERLKANTAKAMGYSQTLSTLGEREPEAAEKFVADPNKAVYLMFNGDLTQMEKDLKEIGTEKEKILLASGVSAEDKREALKDLDDARQQLLKSADALNDQLTDAKLQLKKAQ